MAGAAVIACGCARAKKGPVAAVPPVQVAAVVHLKPTTFVPAQATVRPGDTVTWVWDDPIIHNIVGDGFGTGNQVSGTYSHAFGVPGGFPYQCTIHAGMTGQVDVQP